MALTWRIYLVLHEASGRVYIGQTTSTVAKRWRVHCSKHSMCHKLRNAVNHYGRAAFRIFELYSLTDKASADRVERELIAEHNSLLDGFNITLGGEGNPRNMCKHGHDLNVPGARYSNGGCVECARTRGRAQEAKAKLQRREANPAFYAKVRHPVSDTSFWNAYNKAYAKDYYQRTRGAA